MLARDEGDDGTRSSLASAAHPPKSLGRLPLSFHACETCLQFYVHLGITISKFSSL